jgi:hypothetical protein
MCPAEVPSHVSSLGAGDFINRNRKSLWPSKKGMGMGGLSSWDMIAI